MRTVDFSNVMYRYMQLAGLDRTAITAANYAQFRDFANNRLEQIWKNDYWPDLIRVSDPQTVSVDGNGVRTVAIPSDCGELLSVYDQNPRLTTRARLLKYFLYSSSTQDYVNLIDQTTPVYLEYKTKAPALFGDAYSASSTYSVGAQVYFDTSTNSGSFVPGSTASPAGNLYNCIVATSAGQSPVTTTTSWSKVEIPYFCGDYLARACLADFMRSEGQIEQAIVMENEAGKAMEREVDKVLREQGQVRRPNVFTY